MEADKVVFAEDAMTIHRALGNPVSVGKQKVYNVESVLLEPGQTFRLEDMPDYQKNRLLNEGIPGLALLTEEEVAMRLAERERLLNLQNTISM